MRNVIEEQLLVNLPPEALEDPDTFRNETLYTDACDGVLQVCCAFSRPHGHTVPHDGTV